MVFILYYVPVLVGTLSPAPRPFHPVPQHSPVLWELLTLAVASDSNPKSARKEDAITHTRPSSLPGSLLPACLPPTQWQASTGPVAIPAALLTMACFHTLAVVTASKLPPHSLTKIYCHTPHSQRSWRHPTDLLMITQTPPCKLTIFIRISDQT